MQRGKPFLALRVVTTHSLRKKIKKAQGKTQNKAQRAKTTHRTRKKRRERTRKKKKMAPEVRRAEGAMVEGVPSPPFFLCPPSAALCGRKTSQVAERSHVLARVAFARSTGQLFISPLALEGRAPISTCCATPCDKAQADYSIPSEKETNGHRTRTLPQLDGPNANLLFHPWDAEKKKITSGNLGIFARIPYAIFSPEQRAARVQKLDGNKRENEERKQLDSPAYHGPALFVSRGLRSHTRTFFSQPAMPASEAAVASLNTALERKSKTYR